MKVSVLAVTMSLIVCNCGVRPMDEIGLVDAGLALIQSTTRKVVLVLNFDGQEATRVNYDVPSECIVYLESYDRLSCHAQGKDEDRLVLLSLKGEITAEVRVPKGIRAFSFSPDGSLAYWLVGSTGRESLFVETRGTGQKQQVFDSNVATDNFSVHHPPCWSSDGTVVYFSSASKILRYPVKSRIVEEIALGSNPALSPSGKEVLYRAIDGRLGLLDIATRAVRFLPGAKASWGGRWASNGNFIFFDSIETPLTLTVMNLGTGRSQEVSFRGAKDDLPMSSFALVPRSSLRLAHE